MYAEWRISTLKLMYAGDIQNCTNYKLSTQNHANKILHIKTNKFDVPGSPLNN